MDTVREHLWSQLLLERRLVERDRLAQLVAERDERIRRGQGCSLAQLAEGVRLRDHRWVSADELLHHGYFFAVLPQGGCRPEAGRTFLAARPQRPGTSGRGWYALDVESGQAYSSPPNDPCDWRPFE